MSEKLCLTVSFVLSVAAVLSLIKYHPAFWIVRTVLTIVGIYLPSFLTGIVMLISGIALKEYRGKICLIHSDYFLID